MCQIQALCVVSKMITGSSASTSQYHVEKTSGANKETLKCDKLTIKYTDGN